MTDLNGGWSMKKILGLMIAAVFGLAMAGCAHENKDTQMQPQGSYTTGQAGSQMNNQGTMPGDNSGMQNPSPTNNGMQQNMPPTDNSNMPPSSNPTDSTNMPSNNINNPSTNPNTNNTNNP
jgi:hypothetical protein